MPRLLYASAAAGSSGGGSDGAVDQRDRLREFTSLQKADAKEVQRAEVAGSGPEDLLIQRASAGSVALSMERQSFLKFGFHGGRHVHSRKVGIEQKSR